MRNTELDAADEYLRGESARPGGVVVTLKRLRGLVADAAGLAARVATIIAVAKDLV